MNDRHRTIARYQKRHRKKEENPYFFLNDLGKKLVPVMENLYQALLNTVQKVFDALHDFVAELKMMPEEKYQKTLAELESELTTEQLTLLKKIRGSENDE